MSENSVHQKKNQVLGDMTCVMMPRTGQQFAQSILQADGQ